MPAAGPRVAAVLLDPRDDVAMTWYDVAAGTPLPVTIAGNVVEIVTLEAIPAGHKFAVHALGAGQRIRKYGEFIGRLTSDVPAGAWVHVHNLVTCAHRTGNDERAWGALADPPGGALAIGDAHCSDGAGPLFDAATGCLYFTDARAAALFEIDVASQAQRRWSLAEAAHAVALADDDALLLATASGPVFFDRASGTAHAIASGARPPRESWSDARCDARGRLWCTSARTATTVRAAAGDALVMYEAGLRDPRIVVGDLIRPTGIAWSLDGATLYVAEAGRALIHAHPFDVQSGAVGASRIFADLGAMPGDPGGMALDVEGHLWVVLTDAGCVLRFAPDGSIVRIVRLPVTRPTACAFGGDGHRQLFVTTATHGLKEELLRTQPLAGRRAGTRRRRGRCAAVSRVDGAAVGRDRPMNAPARRTFDGYRRSDGRVGVRNHVLVLSPTGLTSAAAQRMAALVHGTVCVTSGYGRGQVGADARLQIATLAGLATHPNIAAVRRARGRRRHRRRYSMRIVAAGKPAVGLSLPGVARRRAGAGRCRRARGDAVRARRLVAAPRALRSSPTCASPSNAGIPTRRRDWSAIRSPAA